VIGREEHRLAYGLLGGLDATVAGLDRRLRVDVGLLLEQCDRGADVVGRGRAQRERGCLVAHAPDVVARKVGLCGRCARRVVDLGAHSFTRERLRRHGVGKALVRHDAFGTLAREHAPSVHLLGRIRLGAAASPRPASRLLR